MLYNILLLADYHLKSADLQSSDTRVESVLIWQLMINFRRWWPLRLWIHLVLEKISSSLKLAVFVGNWVFLGQCEHGLWYFNKVRNHIVCRVNNMSSLSSLICIYNVVLEFHFSLFFVVILVRFSIFLGTVVITFVITIFEDICIAPENFEQKKLWCFAKLTLDKTIDIHHSCCRGTGNLLWLLSCLSWQWSKKVK